jgi:hypothetical protein
MLKLPTEPSPNAYHLMSAFHAFTDTRYAPRGGCGSGRGRAVTGTSRTWSPTSTRWRAVRTGRAVRRSLVAGSGDRGGRARRHHPPPAHVRGGRRTGHETSEPIQHRLFRPGQHTPTPCGVSRALPSSRRSNRARSPAWRSAGRRNRALRPSRVTTTHRPPDRSPAMNEDTFHGNVGKNPEINHSKNNGTATARSRPLAPRGSPPPPSASTPPARTPSSPSRRCC